GSCGRVDRLALWRDNAPDSHGQQEQPREDESRERAEHLGRAEREGEAGESHEVVR
ncbi:hypothetical protein EVA_10503, partial [gut metagenome]